MVVPDSILWEVRLTVIALILGFAVLAYCLRHNNRRADITFMMIWFGGAIAIGLGLSEIFHPTIPLLNLIFLPIGLITYMVGLYLLAKFMQVIFGAAAILVEKTSPR